MALSEKGEYSEYIDESSKIINTQIGSIKISASITLTSITLSDSDKEKKFNLISLSGKSLELLFESYRDGGFTQSIAEILRKLGNNSDSKKAIHDSMHKILNEFGLGIENEKVVLFDQAPNIKNQVRQNAMDLLSVSRYVDDIKIEYHSDKELLIIDGVNINMQTMQLNVFLYFLADYLGEDYGDSTILDKSALRVHITNINKRLTDTGLTIKLSKTTTSSSYKLKNEKNKKTNNLNSDERIYELSVGDNQYLSFDFLDKDMVKIGDSTYPFSTSRYRILEFLIQNPDGNFTIEDIATGLGEKYLYVSGNINGLIQQLEYNKIRIINAAKSGTKNIYSVGDTPILKEA